MIGEAVRDASLPFRPSLPIRPLLANVLYNLSCKFTRKLQIFIFPCAKVLNPVLLAKSKLQLLERVEYSPYNHFKQFSHFCDFLQTFLGIIWVQDFGKDTQVFEKLHLFGRIG